MPSSLVHLGLGVVEPHRAQCSGSGRGAPFWHRAGVRRHQTLPTDRKSP